MRVRNFQIEGEVVVAMVEETEVQPEVIMVDIEGAGAIEVVGEGQVVVMFVTLAEGHVTLVETVRGNMKAVTIVARQGILNLPLSTKRTWLLECSKKACRLEEILHM